MKIKQSGNIIIVLGIVLGLGACTMTTPSQYEVDRLSIQEGYMTSTIVRDQINNAYWGKIADDYMRNSSGPVNIYVSYPAGVAGENVKADRLVRQYQAALVGKGIEDVNTAIVPIDNMDLSEQVIVSFKSMRAELPEDCPKLTGSYGSESLYDMRDYKLGCENMRYTAKMVSDPTDLLGKSITRDADSRRAGSVVERYRTGEEFEQLESSAASEVD